MHHFAAPLPAVLWFALLLASASANPATRLPEQCKPPPSGAQALQEKATSRAYGEVGAWFAQQGNLTCAQAAFEQAVQLEPRSAQAHYNLGVVRARARQADAAAAEFRLALKYKPGMTLAHNALGAELVGMGKPGEAEAEFREALRQDPNSVVALDQLAQRFASEREYARAVRYWKRALALEPDSRQMQLSMGSAADRSGDPDESMRIFSGLVKAHPEMKLAHLGLGDLYSRASMFHEAAIEYAEAARLDPQDDFARRASETARSRDVESRSEKTSSHQLQLRQLADDRRKASGLLADGQPAQAAAVYRKMLEIEPHDAHTEYGLALALEAEHELQGQRAALERAAKLDPKMAAVQAALGRLDLAAGNSVLAEMRLQAAIASDPQWAPALGDLGIIRASKDDQQAAEKLFRRAIEADPGYEPAYVNLALILAKQQKFAEAQAQADQAVKLAPQDAAALAAAGRVKVRLGKTVESIALMRRAVALAPQSANAHLDLGMVLAETYDLSGALTENDEAVRLAPGSALAHLNRGRVLFDLGRNEEAQSELEAARRIAPLMPEPAYFLAVIEKQAGHYERAASLLQTVVKLQPRNAMAWHLLGQSLENQSRTQEAIAAWKQALAIDPKYSQALWSLARAIKPGNPNEAARLMARYSDVLKERHIVDEAGTLGNDALAAGAAHEWPEAIHRFEKAIEVCGNCAIKADLHKKLGLTACRMGDIDRGEKELQLARTLKPDDPDIGPALERIAAARSKAVADHPAAAKSP